jgi:hypothetical protein
MPLDDTVAEVFADLPLGLLGLANRCGIERPARPTASSVSDAGSGIRGLNVYGKPRAPRLAPGGIPKNWSDKAPKAGVPPAASIISWPAALSEPLALSPPIKKVPAGPIVKPKLEDVKLKETKSAVVISVPGT